MGHDYDVDVQIDGLGPVINGTTPQIGAQAPALPCPVREASAPSIGRLTMPTLDRRSPPAPSLQTARPCGSGIPLCLRPAPAPGCSGDGVIPGITTATTICPPAGLLQLYGNFATQTSQHFASNHVNQGWVLPDLFAYTFDETYNYQHAKDLGTPNIYKDVSLFNEAINSSNSALSSTWDPSTAPIRTFLTDEPACQESGDNPNYSDQACADHINLSYPGGTNSTSGYPNAWVGT